MNATTLFPFNLCRTGSGSAALVYAAINSPRVFHMVANAEEVAAPPSEGGAATRRTGIEFLVSGRVTRSAPPGKQSSIAARGFGAPRGGTPNIGACDELDVASCPSGK